MECLPLFAQCRVTAGMPGSLLVVRAGLQASQESQEGHPCTPPPTQSSIQSPPQPQAQKPGYGH